MRPRSESFGGSLRAGLLRALIGMLLSRFATNYGNRATLGNGSWLRADPPSMASTARRVVDSWLPKKVLS